MTTNSVAPVGRLTTAIALRGVGKRYRLYSKPVYRLLDLFGACPATPKYYSEHLAVKDVDLEIGRGEKVAIIGRNGAGKSTLLKLITGLVQPTSGSIEVNGQVSNLLQIGSGFHPDFTGRQNVYASLAHQGIVGKEAARLFDEIMAFAEIEEYIDQPMKTYSTGMCSRLMFSSSIVIRPEILIVDEILGVGDAYFAHKSFERMRKVCSQDGTTLLLVTHDIYSALNLCDRFIWLDRGAVKFDGDGKSAIALYETSIKDQEEHSLRLNAAKLSPGRDNGPIHVLFRSPTGFALAAPLALDSVTVKLADGNTTTLPVSKGAGGWTLLPESNLSPVQEVDGRPCRVLRTSGSIFHKAEWAVALPSRGAVEAVSVSWRYAGEEGVDLRVFTAERGLLVSGSLGAGDSWQEQVFPRTDRGPKELDPLKQTDYGTGKVRITRVEFLDVTGRDVVEVLHGQPLTIRVHLSIEPALADRRATFIVAFVRHGSPYSACVYSPDLALGAGESAIITAKIDSVQLGSGRWYVNIALGEPALLERSSSTYFALDPGWYHLLASRIEFRVGSASHLDASGVFVVQQAAISVDAVPLESDPLLAGAHD